MQKSLGTQNAGKEGADFFGILTLLHEIDPPLKLNSKNILSYAIF